MDRVVAPGEPIPAAGIVRPVAAGKPAPLSPTGLDVPGRSPPRATPARRPRWHGRCAGERADAAGRLTCAAAASRSSRRRDAAARRASAAATAPSAGPVHGRRDASKTITTDTLAPPTALRRPGARRRSRGRRHDAYASGYEVQRSTMSGSAYTFVKTVTPVRATADHRRARRRHVLLRAPQRLPELAERRTATRRPVTLGGDLDRLQGLHRRPRTPPTPAATGTATKRPAATPAPTTTRSPRTPATGHEHDSSSCTDAGQGPPPVLGLRARRAGHGHVRRRDPGPRRRRAEQQRRTSTICAQLSWDGGTTWTAAERSPCRSSAIDTYTLGAQHDTWGRTWTGPDLEHQLPRPVTDVSDRSGKDIRLDFLAVQVDLHAVGGRASAPVSPASNASIAAR